MKNLPPFPVRLLALLLIFSGLCPVLANTTPPRHQTDTTAAGIRFFTGTWQGLLAEAKKQNKPIFIDIFTTWCGPCKLMAKQAFPDRKVGELFNSQFISYQLDAEKGEGPALARQYGVEAYPTSLYVSANGELIHRAVGYGGVNEFMAEANKAVVATTDPRPISVWDQEFAGGKRDVAFLQTYLAKRAKLGLPNAEALSAYLAAAPRAQWTTPANVEALAGNLTTANSPAFDALLEFLKTNRNNKALAPTTDKVRQAIGQAVYADQKETKTEADLEKVVANQQKARQAMSETPVTASQALEQADETRMNFYQRTKNMARYRQLATTVGKRHMAITTEAIKASDAASYKKFMTEAATLPDSVKTSPNFVRYDKMMRTIETQQLANKLNGLAWTYYENMTDPADLNTALAWSGRSLELDRSAAQLDTYAQLLGKLGRKAEAIKTEQEALDKAKATGEDVTEYEKTLAALKK